MTKKAVVVSLLLSPVLCFLSACTSIFSDTQAEAIYTALQKKEDPGNKIAGYSSLRLTYENAASGVTLVMTFKRPSMLLFETFRKGEKVPFLAYGLKNGVLREKSEDQPVTLIYNGPMRASFQYLYESKMDMNRIVDSVSSDGLEYIDNILCDKLNLHLKTKYAVRQITLYISRETGYCIRSVCAPDPNLPNELWTDDFSDFRNYDGVVFPGQVSTTFGKTMTIFKLQKVEPNLSFPDTIFDFQTEGK